MKVLLASRPNAFEVLGGDTIQMIKIRDYLLKSDINVTISSQVDDVSVRQCDVLHVFNLFDTDSTHYQGAVAFRNGIPLVLTPNYWDPMEYLYYTSPSVCQTMLRRLVPLRLGLGWYRTYKQNKDKKIIEKQKELLTWSTMVVPNSHLEKEHLMRCFQVRDEQKFHVVPNAVEAGIQADPDVFVKQYSIHDFILCVGRFEERKNQLNLIRALRDVDIPLVFIGGCPAHQQAYLAECRRAVKQGKLVLFLDQLEQKDVFNAMAAAKVHVLPSWWENTGLVNLEAVVLGCNVVSTVNAPVDEYFKKWAFTCRPASLDSIRKAVLNAYHAPFRDELKDYVTTHFNWDIISRQLLHVYENMVNAAC